MDTNNFSNESQPKIEQNEYSPGLYFLLTLLKYKYLIIIITTLVTAAAVFIALKMPDWYSSTVTLLPPRNTSSFMSNALGNISTALKDFGITKIGSKSNDPTYSFASVLESRNVKDSIIKRFNLREVYEAQDLKESELRKAFEENVEIKLDPEGYYSITIWDKDPNRAAEIANAYFFIANDYVQVVYRQEAALNLGHLEKRVAQVDSLIKLYGDSLSAFSRKYELFSPDEQAANYGKALAEIQAEKIKQEIIYDAMVLKFGESDVAAQAQKQLISNFNDKIQALKSEPGFAGNFALSNATSVGVEYIRYLTEFETFSKVKAFLLPVLEEARLEQVKMSQALFVLDEAIPADKKSRPRRSLIVAAAFAGALAFSILCSFSIEGIRTTLRKYKEHKATL